MVMTAGSSATTCGGLPWLAESATSRPHASSPAGHRAPGRVVAENEVVSVPDGAQIAGCQAHRRRVLPSKTAQEIGAAGRSPAAPNSGTGSGGGLSRAAGVTGLAVRYRGIGVPGDVLSSRGRVIGRTRPGVGAGRIADRR
jgi:hypothetical protein